jgi:hypothetical protein
MHDRQQNNNATILHFGKGFKGIFPLVCLPNWGREGVTLRASFKKKFNNELIKEFCISISVVKRIA